MSKLNRKFHPGVYLKDIIDEYGMSHHEFAMRLGMDDKRLSLIVNEKSRITVDDALKLSQLLNTSVDVWLNLQNAYDIYIYITKLNKQNEFEYEKEIYRLIGASFLKKVHIISNERTIEVSLFSSIDEPYEIYIHYGIMDGVIYTDQEHAYALREEVKQVLEKEYLNTKEPSSKFIDEFAKKYHLCLPNDLYFDSDALFEAMLNMKF